MKFNIEDILRFLIYSLIIFSFVGASVIALPVYGLGMLSAYRFMIIALIVTTLVLSLAYGYKLRSMISGNVKYIYLFYLLWFIYAVLSAFWVKDIQGWGRAVFSIFIGAVSIFYIIFYINTSERLQTVLKSLFILFVIINVLGWYEVITQDYLFPNNDPKILDYFKLTRSPVVWSFNINDFGVLIGFGAFLSILNYIHSERILFKILSVLLCISSSVLVVFTTSRGALFALILGMVFFFLFDRSVKKMVKKSIKIAAVLLPILLFIVAFFMNDDIRTFLMAIDLFTTGVVDVSPDGSDAVRINLIRNGVLFFIESWGIGIGAGNMEYWMGHYGVYYTGGLVNIHNWWVELLAVYGIVVISGYLWMYYYLLRKFWNIFSNIAYSYKIRQTAKLCIAYLIAFAFFSVISSSLLATEWVWIVFGLLAAMVNTYYNIEKSYTH